MTIIARLTQIALAWQHLGEAGETGESRPNRGREVPAGMRTVAFRRPSWSQDGAIVFLGVARWRETPAREKKSADNSKAPETKRDDSKEEEEPASVDVWHARDVTVMPKQKIDARQDSRRNLVAAWHINDSRLVQLGQNNDEQVTPLKYQKIGYVRNWSSTAMERSIGRSSAELSLVDLGTGERFRIKERLSDDFYVQGSPAGRYILFLQDDQYWTVNTASRAVVSITRACRPPS
jgi:hypothetical protein